MSTAATRLIDVTHDKLTPVSEAAFFPVDRFWLNRRMTTVADHVMWQFEYTRRIVLRVATKCQQTANNRWSLSRSWRGGTKLSHSSRKKSFTSPSSRRYFVLWSVLHLICDQLFYPSSWRCDVRWNLRQWKCQVSRNIFMHAMASDVPWAICCSKPRNSHIMTDDVAFY